MYKLESTLPFNPTKSCIGGICRNSSLVLVEKIGACDIALQYRHRIEPRRQNCHWVPVDLALTLVLLGEIQACITSEVKLRNVNRGREPGP
jgi:hypothetical protein